MGCSQCGACCKLFVIEIPGLQSDRLKLEYFKAHGYKVKGNQVVVPTTCPHLTEDNKCDMHERKPFLCKQYKGQTKGFYKPEVCTYG